MNTAGFMKEIDEKIQDQADAIDLIAAELTFILKEAQKTNPAPGSPLGNELAQKFLSLYEDFKKIRANAIRLNETVSQMTFMDRAMELVYKGTTDLLVRKMKEGIFAQFITVAEFGVLPEETA